jgi:hypothetical protein
MLRGYAKNPKGLGLTFSLSFFLAVFIPPLRSGSKKKVPFDKTSTTHGGQKKRFVHKQSFLFVSLPLFAFDHAGCTVCNPGCIRPWMLLFFATQRTKEREKEKG